MTCAHTSQFMEFEGRQGKYRSYLASCHRLRPISSPNRASSSGVGLWYLSTITSGSLRCVSLVCVRIKHADMDCRTVPYLVCFALITAKLPAHQFSLIGVLVANGMLTVVHANIQAVLWTTRSRLVSSGMRTRAVRWPVSKAGWPKVHGGRSSRGR
jgi:hypothetical protein